MIFVFFFLLLLLFHEAKHTQSYIIGHDLKILYITLYMIAFVRVGAQKHNFTASHDREVRKTAAGTWKRLEMFQHSCFPSWKVSDNLIGKSGVVHHMCTLIRFYREDFDRSTALDETSENLSSQLSSRTPKAPGARRPHPLPGTARSNNRHLVGQHESEGLTPTYLREVCQLGRTSRNTVCLGVGGPLL